MRFSLVTGTSTTVRCNLLDQDTRKRYNTRKTLSSLQKALVKAVPLLMLSESGKMNSGVTDPCWAAGKFGRRLVRANFCVRHLSPLVPEHIAITYFAYRRQQELQNPPVSSILHSLDDGGGAWLLSWAQAFKGRKNQPAQES